MSPDITAQEQQKNSIKTTISTEDWQDDGVDGGELSKSPQEWRLRREKNPFRVETSGEIRRRVSST